MSTKKSGDSQLEHWSTYKEMWLLLGKEMRGRRKIHTLWKTRDFLEIKFSIHSGMFHSKQAQNVHSKSPKKIKELAQSKMK